MPLVVDYLRGTRDAVPQVCFYLQSDRGGGVRQDRSAWEWEGMGVAMGVGEFVAVVIG